MSLRTSVLTLLVCVLAAAAQAQQLTGVGGTFPAPVYRNWAKAAKTATGIDLAYDAAGSGKGQAAAIAHTTDFGASDAPMPPDKLAANDLLQFPTLIGAIVPIVNLPRVRDDELKLSGQALADIYAGKIRKWNDPRLIKLNPGVKLPNVSIATVHRYDASGSSFVFTSYLASVSPEWKATVGIGEMVAWPVGAGAIGNDGVATTVDIIRGGIGYVEYAFAVQNHLSTVRLRNHAGVFVQPTTASFAAAAADWSVADFDTDPIDTRNPSGWPLVTPTFVLVSKDPEYLARTTRAVRFFNWAFANGGAIATKLDFIPLPAAVRDRVRAAWHNALGVPTDPIVAQ